MTAPSNANTSGLDVVAWRKNVWVAEGIGTGWMLSNEQPEPNHQPTDIEPLVTAASAQGRIADSEKKAELYDHMKLVAEANGFKSLTEAIARATAAEARADRLAKALERIERWFGEFPETGEFWTNDDGSESDRPMSYSACWGSNGERDYMRSIARAALQQETQP